MTSTRTALWRGRGTAYRIAEEISNGLLLGTWESGVKQDVLHWLSDVGAKHYQDIRANIIKVGLMIIPATFGFFIPETADRSAALAELKERFGSNTRFAD